MTYVGECKFKQAKTYICRRHEGENPADMKGERTVSDADIYTSSLLMTVLSIESENAKLRDLVSWMYDRMDESCAVQHPYMPAPIRYDQLMQALARARELGVEVG